MAEVFALAAGGLGLAPVVLEIAKTAKTLKEYCRDVRNAPRDIQDFVEEVECIGEILLQLKALGTSPVPPNKSALQQCQKANRALAEVATEVQGSLDLRKRLAFPLRKGKIAQLQAKLERAKTSLLLACSSQQINVLQSTFALVQRQIADQDSSFQQLASSNTAIMSTLTTVDVSRKPKSNGQTMDSDFRERRGQSASRAMRLLDFVWDACLARSAGGWTRSFRSYRVVYGVGDPAFRAASCGDLGALQRLLCSHEATINDRTSYGSTLVWVSILKYPHAIMQLLTNNSGLCISNRSTSLAGS